MSEIKVNKISQRSGTAITLGNSGTDFQLPSGADIVAQSGSTITIAAGATITNSGTATGFGRTGAVDWDTTKKTTGFTAVNGVGYFCDTTSGAFTMTLPATPSAGAIVALKDYANTFDTNNLTVGRNGSNINGFANNAIISVQGQSLTLIYIDVTQGWSAIYGATDSDLPAPAFVAATGGTILTCGNFKTHVFTGPGTFTVSCAGNPGGSDSVEYLVVAGAAGGSSDWGGGSGAGGWRSRSIAPTAHPLNAPANLPVSVQGYPITVGAAGSVGGQNQLGGNGSDSVFSTITSTGGGRAGNEGNNSVGAAGGSGGGGGTSGGPGCGCGGAGNTPPTSPPQGNNGGSNPVNSTGYTAGGGGAGGVGESIPPGCNTQIPGGAGGIGAYVVDGFIGPTAPSYGTPGPVSNTRYFAGGGGGAAGSAAAVAQAAAAAVLSAKNGGDVTVTSGHQRAQIMSKLANRPSKVLVYACVEEDTCI